MTAVAQEQSNGGVDRRAERGSAFIMALLLAVVVLVLGATYLTVSMTDYGIASNEADHAVAFNLAEAGIEHAIAELPDQDVDALLTSGGVLFNGTSLGAGTYTTTITNNIGPDFPTGIVPADAGGAADDTDRFLVATSEGRSRQSRSVIRVVVELTGDGLLDYVLYGQNEVKGSGGGAIIGNVHSNGNVKNSFAIDGDASAGGTVDDPAIVTGTVTDGAAPILLPDIACPAIPYGPAPVGPDVNFDPVTGEFSTGDDVVFPAGTYFFSSFTKTGGGKSIFINAGERVEIYVSGKFVSTGGGWHNPNPSAEMLQVWSCGGNTQDFNFTGGDSSRLTIYAPGSKVTMTGGGDKIGAFIGKTISMSGGANVTYDPSLSGSDGVTIVPGSWTNL